MVVKGKIDVSLVKNLGKDLEILRCLAFMSSCFSLPKVHSNSFYPDDFVFESVIFRVSQPTGAYYRSLESIFVCIKALIRFFSALKLNRVLLCIFYFKTCSYKVPSYFPEIYCFRVRGAAGL